jgi:hypothetical protein
MDMNLKENCEKAFNEIELQEFELEDSENFHQRLDGISLIVKKLFLLDILKLMQPFESELSEADLNEFRGFYKEIASKIGTVIHCIRNGNRLGCDDVSFCILEKILPYIKGSIKGIAVYPQLPKILA